MVLARPKNTSLAQSMSFLSLCVDTQESNAGQKFRFTEVISTILVWGR